MKYIFLVASVLVLSSCATFVEYDEIHKAGKVLSKEIGGTVSEGPIMPANVAASPVGVITWHFLDSLLGKKKDVYVYIVRLEDNSLARIASFSSGFSIDDCVKVIVFTDKGAGLKTDSIREVRMAYGADCSGWLSNKQTSM